jgi:ribonuclease Z
MFKVTILGNSAAVPTPDKNTTAQVLRYEQHTFLLDCGEGTQIQILKYKVKSNFKAIFITHLHGDHCFGLVPLLSSMTLNGRKEKLQIIGPKNLQNYIQTQLDFTSTYLSFEVEYIIPETENKVIYENEHLEVRAFSLKHRIETYGYMFKEKKRSPKFLVEKARELQVPPPLFKLLKKGNPVENIHGVTIYPEQVLGEQKMPLSYAFCTDTAFYPDIVPYLQNATLLYHEATFKHNEIQKAQETLHSTATEAAIIAKSANVQKLLIGHFSARYIGMEQELVQEAQTIFPNTEYATEGKTFFIE